MGAHSAQTPTLGIHGAIAYVAADEAARLALGPFVSTDRFKQCFQEDTEDIYMLIDTSGPTWKLVGGSGAGTPPLIPTEEKTANYTAQPGELAVFYVASGSRDCLFAPGVNAGDQIGAVIVPGSGGEVIIDTSPTLIGPVPPHSASGSSGTVYGTVWVWDAVNTAWVLMSTINIPLS